MCKCESKKDGIYIDDEGMHIWDGEYADYDLYEIKYCPYCGEKVRDE